MRKKKQKMWVISPGKSVKASKTMVPESLKEQVQETASQLVETVLKPKNIKPPPKDMQFNYITDIHTRWRQKYFYFCSTYRCPAPNCITPEFELCFARMEYAGDYRFKLSYMRHTGKWWELYTGLSLDEALASIRDEPHFMP